MSSIVVATICAMFIAFSEANIKPGIVPKIPPHNPLLDEINDACMLMGTANYSVSRMVLDSPLIGGCVQYDLYRNSDSESKTFTVWLDNMENGRQKCGQEGMEQIIFSCKEFSKTSLSSNDDATKYVRLFGRDANQKGVKSIRCALFEKDEINSKTFRLAMSGNNSCVGLAKVFSDILPRIPKGSKFLKLTREPELEEPQSRNTRSVKKPTSSIRNEDWYTVWMLG